MSMSVLEFCVHCAKPLYRLEDMEWCVRCGRNVCPVCEMTSEKSCIERADHEDE